MSDYQIKVSVIVPVYNVERFLPECLDSVLRQTLRDIEIICINDGSPDNCPQIIRDYAARDSRIVAVDQKNAGVGRARNAGIRKARGEYCIFLDPDDFYPTDDILETLYQNAVEHRALICGGRFAEYRQGKYVTEFAPDGILWGYVFERDGFIDYRDWQFEYGYHRFVYQTEFLRKNKIYYPPLVRFQDPPFFVKAMITAGRFYALNKMTYALRCGHQRINWTYEKVRDLLTGLLYNLKISKQHKLAKLHYMTYRRLTTEFEKMVKNQVNHVCIWVLLARFHYNIDKQLMRQANPQFKNELYRRFMKELLQKLFSVKNSADKRHKVITFLGIRAKIKRR